MPRSRRGTVAADAMLDAARDDQRLIRLIEVGRSLLSELNLDIVLDRVLETARDLTGARHAALGILDERRRELAQFLTRGIDEETHRAIGDLPRGRGILGLLIEDPRPLRIADVGDHPRSYAFPPPPRPPPPPPPRSFPPPPPADARLSRRADRHPRRGVGEPVPHREGGGRR